MGYVGGYWYRFQGHKWLRYGATVPIKPKAPRGAKICRPFYMLKKWGFPSTLGAKTLPRCRVGSGKSSVYYMWKNRKNCRFLGGRLTYQKHAVCKVGKPHQWARVVRCVQGPILSKKGLNYKTGRSMRHSSSKREVVLGGMRVGGCYKLRAFAHTKDYFSNVGTFAFNSETSTTNIWKIVPGIDGTKTPSLSRTRPADTDSCFTAKTEQDSTGTSILTRKTPLSTSQKDSWEEVSHSCQFIREDTS